MRTLFWSLFDLMDLDNLDSAHDNMFFTETVGIILYGVYMLIAAIVMVNALIAMMNNTYNKVEVSIGSTWSKAYGYKWQLDVLAYTSNVWRIWRIVYGTNGRQGMKEVKTKRRLFKIKMFNFYPTSTMPYNENFLHHLHTAIFQHLCSTVLVTP